MMKKLIATILAVIMVLGLGCAAMADEVPETEAGKKFNGNWAIMGGLVEINYEEEGYRVNVEICNRDEMSGQIWMYSCYYNEEKDVLESVSSMVYPYTLDPDTMDRIPGDFIHEGIDDENEMTVFAINEEGKLTWAEGLENAGADLEFQPIGNFSGIWQNEAEEIYVEISWQGMEDQETFHYMAFISRGRDEHEADFNMTGLYNWETGKLELTGTVVTFVRNDDGLLDPVEDPDTYEAFFSMQEDGKLLFETDNGIELDYVDVPGSNG